MARFEENSALADTGNTKADLKSYVENLKPRSDLVVTDELLISGNKIGLANNAGKWVKYSKSYTDFPTAANTSADSTIVSLGAGAVIEAVKVVVTTAFAGGSVSACTVDVGTTASTPTEYINLGNIFAATTTTGLYYTSGPNFLTENASTPILTRIICTSDTCDNLTAGAFDVWLKYSIADSVI
jgi:hypothetical protein